MLNSNDDFHKMVYANGNKPVTTTLAIAGGINKPHATIIKLIRAHHEDFEEFGSVRFEIRVSGRGGSPVTFAILNEQQATLLMTYQRNTPIVRKFKVALVKAFFEIANRLHGSLLRHYELKQIQLKTAESGASHAGRSLNYLGKQLKPRLKHELLELESRIQMSLPFSEVNEL